MLKELKVKNFISYDELKQEFPSPATIAVVGENGAGKSSALEAIRFALFGDGRDDQRGLIRLGSVGGMMCAVILEDVPLKDQILKVERGVKANGTGYTKVWLNGVLAEQGGAKPTNNKAQDFIDDVLGIDQDTFGLTSFFGLGANDTLMQVRPADRLETLQKLAEVDICKKFHKRASDQVKDLKALIEREMRAVEVLTEMIGDSSGLQSELNGLVAKLKKVKEKQDALAVERNNLIRTEKGFRSLSVERGKLKSGMEFLTGQINTDADAIIDLADSVGSVRDEIDDLKKKSIEYKDAIKGKTIKKYDDDNTKAIEDIFNAEAGIELRRKALAVGKIGGLCPLCGSEIQDHSKEEWMTEIKVLREKAKNAMDRRDVSHAERALVLRNESIIDKNTVRIKGLQEQQVKDKNLKERREEDISRNKVELQTKTSRMKAVKGALKGYDVLNEKLAVIEDTLSQLMADIGGLNQTIKLKREQMKKIKEAIQKKRTMVFTIKTSTENMLSYQVVAEGFSRYAIPVQLLRNLREAIENRASRIYQEFNSGLIKISDIEGAKPGVEFVLQDQMGQRAYKSLSTGEKVMVFLSVRVAITQIINASRDNKVDFLILDEVAGNLSVSRRESLTKLINGFLKRFFPQVFMISHVPMRDIFDKMLRVEKIDGVSSIKVHL